MKAFYRFICFWLLASFPATAQLTFEFREQTFQKKSADGKVEVTFPFKNATDVVIEIKSVTSSCGCTTPALQKKTYNPGESGEIRATFKFGQRTGRQVKYITVAYGSPENVPDERLKLEVMIVAPVLALPRLVFWKRNSEPVARKISVELDPDLELENVEVSSSNAHFRTELSEKRDGHYDLSVTPDTTTGQQSAIIKIEASTADGQVKHTVSAYARVQ